jgi:hypothetical protein
VNTEEETYIIHHNYTDNGKILGTFEKKSVITAIAWVVLLSFVNFWLLPIPFDAKLYVLIILIIPPAVFLLLGVDGEPLVDFLVDVAKFYKNAKVYFYEK